MFREGSIRIEADFLTKSGERIPYSLNATRIKNEDGEPIGLTGVGRDISERKKAEERFKQLFNAIPNPTYFVDKEGVFKEVNEATVELLGYEREEIIGQHLLEVPFFPSETKEKIGKKFKKRLAGKEISPYRVKTETKNGKTLYVEINATLIEEEGEPVGSIAIARDVTDLKKSEERKEFLQTFIRQDLRSKYQTIQGFLQLIEEEDLSERNRRYLKKAMGIGQGAYEILDLAEDLEDIEKSEGFTEKIIIKVLKRVTDNLSGLVEKKGVEIEKNYPEKILKVKGNYSVNTLLSQLLTIRIQLSECDKIRIDVKEREKEILLRIEDDGKRLPDEIKNLFSGDVYTGETTGAGGVRYYMLREIAEHNDCRIEVKDSEMGGARFDLELKRADQ